MLILLLLIRLINVPSPHITKATRYADTAKDEGGTPACWRRCVIRAPNGMCIRKFSSEIFDRFHSLRVAHRTLPCGTLVLIRTTNRSAFGMVLDRGPYGRCLMPGRSAKHSMNVSHSRLPLSKTKSPSEVPARICYRGDLDLSPRVADSLGLTLRIGRMLVKWWVIV